MKKGDAKISDLYEILEDSAEDEGNEKLGIPKQTKKPNLMKQELEMELINDPFYDLKPYMGSYSEWKKRVTRLEQKLCNLAPTVVLLSLELYQRALHLLVNKLKKFL